MIIILIIKIILITQITIYIYNSNTYVYMYMYMYTYMSHHDPKWRASFWDGCTTNHLKSMMPSGASRGWAQLERGPFGLCCIDPPNPGKSGEISPSSWCKLRGCRILRQLYCLYCVFWSLCWDFFGWDINSCEFRSKSPLVQHALYLANLLEPEESWWTWLECDGSHDEIHCESGSATEQSMMYFNQWPGEVAQKGKIWIDSRWVPPQIG